MKHVISALVKNEVGVLAHVAEPQREVLAGVEPAALVEHEVQPPGVAGDHPPPPPQQSLSTP